MLVGPRSTKEEREMFRQRLLANPANYIGQETLALSTCPTFVEGGLSPRHIDLRPFVLSGRDSSGAGRSDAGGAHRRLAGGELIAGRGTKDTG